MKNEEWRDIEDFEDYQVSSHGRVRNSRFDRILCQYDSGMGYMKVGLMKNGKLCKQRVNRLVAKAFLENPKGFRSVRYKTSDRTNNHVENLMWSK